MKPELVRNSRQPRTNLNLKRNYIPKTLEQECLSRVRISHKFHGLFCLISVWMFMFSRRSAVASAFTALQCVEVLPCVRGYLEKQLCTGDVCEFHFHFFANHLIHSLPWYAREIEQRNVQRVTWGGSCGVVTSVPHYLWRSWRVPCAPYVCYIVYYFNEM